jgi:distribution and morphology protein 31
MGKDSFKMLSSREFAESWVSVLYIMHGLSDTHTCSIDRSHIHWDPTKTGQPIDYRRVPGPNDFDLDSLSIEDMLITVHQPGSFRPFPMSIFRADFTKFRKQWLFWDFLHAETVVGQYDGCLFSLHKPQSMGRTNERDLKDSPWSRIVCVYIIYVSLLLTYDASLAAGSTA